MHAAITQEKTICNHCDIHDHGHCTPFCVRDKNNAVDLLIPEPGPQLSIVDDGVAGGAHCADTTAFMR